MFWNIYKPFQHVSMLTMSLCTMFFYKIPKLWKLIAHTKFSQVGNMTPLFYNSHQLSNVVRFLLLNMILLFKLLLWVVSSLFDNNYKKTCYCFCNVTPPFQWNHWDSKDTNIIWMKHVLDASKMGSYTYVITYCP
jgi:hypothetical protein